MKTDYPELEGKEVTRNDSDAVGIVRGCNFYIGITIEYKDTPGKYLVCLHGEQSPYIVKKLLIPPPDKKLYSAFFHELVGQIQCGVLNAERLAKVIIDNGHEPFYGKPRYCAFNV